jgi:TolA-binding protein
MKPLVGRLWLVCVAGMLGTAWGADRTAEEWVAAVRLMPAPVRQALQDRDYPAAVKAIEELQKTKPADRDYLAYLRGWALCLDKKYDQAVASLEQMEKDFPASVWLRRARFAKGIAMAKKRDFQAAEAIFRTEAEYLLSAKRREPLAEVYLEFADKAYRPADKDQEPRYGEAMSLYQQALDVGPSSDKRPEVELRIGLCFQREKNPAEAARRFEEFIKRYDKDPRDAEARYRLGECRLEEKNAREARRVWQDLLAKHAQTPSPFVALAAFDLAKTWQIPQPEHAEDLSLGVAALDAFLERFPGHELAGTAHLLISQSYVHRGQHESAVASLKRLIADPRCRDRKEVPEAWHLLATCYRTQKKFDEALATWREFLVKFPTHESWTKAQQEIVTTEYLMGEEQYKAKNYDEAVKLWSGFLTRYPLDARNPGILLSFGRIEADRKNPDDAITAWRRLAAKHPNSPEASQAKALIAQTLEEMNRLDEALEEYRKNKSDSSAAQAIARLTRPAMSVDTPRIFRTDETPRLALWTRNVESVTVRAYKVDLETYFRKTHTIGGVERLDIALIDPDRTFEFKVPGYAKHRLIESAVEVALPEGQHAGVMAVTVSTETMEATTLVLQTDLDLILKGSPDEAFVLAENLRTGKPWPGVRLLVSNGRRVLAETKTDAQGICRQKLDNLEGGDVRIFAVADGNVASTDLVVKGSVGEGLADRGYIYTDMPAYRPGGRVHVRGCLRQVDNNALVVPKEPQCTLQCSTPATAAWHSNRSSSAASARSRPSSTCRPIVRWASTACWSATRRPKSTRATSRSKPVAPNW